MLFIGNDIISFNDPANRSSFSDPQFIRKVLTVAELELFQQNSVPEYLPWLFWTCKESAYKIALKKGFDKSFAPGSYEVRLKNPYDIAETHILKGTVEFCHSKVFFTSKIEVDFISTIACTKEEFLSETKSTVDKTLRTNHSELAREQLSKELLSLLKIKKSTIEIYKNNNGVPFIKLNNSMQVPDISFSHDGNFFSYAYLFKN